MSDWGNDPLVGDDIPTMTVTAKAPSARLGKDDLRKKITALGYSEAGADGIIQNIMRESRGDASVVGDGGTSLGLFQHHATRKADLEAFAKEAGKPATDPDVQIAFFDQEMKTKFPRLREQLTKADNAGVAEDAFKRIYERPASVLWANRPNGKPVLETDDFKYSPYAMREKRRNTDVVLMSPDDYLALSPDLDADAMNSRKGKSLRASLGRGEPIEAIPTLDMEVKDGQGTITDQDGRHRAMAAQEAGADAVPVAIRRTGSGPVTEVQGMGGKIVPHDFNPLSWLTSRAEAAEPAKADDWGNDPLVEWGNDPQQSADGVAMSAVKGAAAGFGRMALGAQELVGKGLEAAGADTAGQWLVGDARKGLARLAGDMAPDEAAHPWASAVGEVVGSSIAPGGAAAKIGGSAVRMGMTAGALSGLLEPAPDDENFLKSKAIGTAEGGVVGGMMPYVGGRIAAAVKPTFRAAAQKLIDEGVYLTPGQLAGGVVKRAEDIMASIPGLGVAVRSGLKRSYDSFNRAAVNRALEPIGEKLPASINPGRDAVDYVAHRLGDAYDKVIPKMAGSLDADLKSDIVKVAQLGANLPPELSGQLNRVIQHDLLAKFTPGGRTSGQAMQDLGSQLGGMSDTMRIDKDPDVRRLGTAIRELDASIDRMMDRSNPGLAAQKKVIDAAYANFKIVERAAGGVGAPGGVFSPAQLLNAVKAGNKSKDKAAFARGNALMQDLADAAKDILPPQVPDSGTPERLLMSSALSGSAFANPGLAAAAGATALPYTAPGMSLLRMFATGAPQTRQAMSNTIRNGVGLIPPEAGAMAASILRPQSGQQQ